MLELPLPRQFTTTRWSVVLRIRGSSPEESQAALEELCRLYWYPLYAYIRRKGRSAEDAADLTQGFFAKLLANDFALGLSPHGGRFRSFLLTALNRFLVDEWRTERRQKRGGGGWIDSLESLIAERGEASYLGELGHSETPERLFQRIWAETLFARVLKRLADENACRKDSRFMILEPFLSLDGDPPPLAEAAAQLKVSIPAFKSLLHRLRHRYRELLHEEVNQTLVDGQSVDEELQNLLRTLQGD